MELCTHEFASTPVQLRRALESHREWLEQQLGAQMKDTAIFTVDLNLTEIACERIFGCGSRSDSTAIRRFRALVISAEVPPHIPAILNLSPEAPAFDIYAGYSPGSSELGPAWGDTPVLFRLKGLSYPIVAMDVAYRAAIGSDCERIAHVVLARRDSAAELLRLLQDLTQRDNQPTLSVFGGNSRRILRSEWDDLILDKATTKLLREDFEAFFDREGWFRQHQIPFRRGYLLHGPPGNGKSTAIRAMMTSRGLTAYTMRMFDQYRDDGDLERMFDEAWRSRPSMIVFEDLDRVYPKTGQTKSSVSLQQLLNCLDGIATGEGTVVVATANEPALLDPAILRRPGRFDRVVHFPNPNSELRHRYLRHMGCKVNPTVADGAVAASEGLAFAQLREAYVLAGQQAFDRGTEVTEADLLAGIQILRQGVLLGTNRSTLAGFTSKGGER